MGQSMDDKSSTQGQTLVMET
ncbi:hypothetical protein A2U01_0112731, partial [Trifolium medium]|nr:hypothetical protein [Trifolium medium]